MIRALHEHWIEEPIELIAPYIHPEAEMRLLITYGELVRGRDAVMRAMQEGREASTWRAAVNGIEWVRPDVAITSGYARYPLRTGGFGEGKVFWLDELRDDMIWRVHVFRSEEEVRRAHGHVLNGDEALGRTG
jgi:hypothetical protein